MAKDEKYGRSACTRYRRQTRRKYSCRGEDPIVLEGLRGEEEHRRACRRERHQPHMYTKWRKNLEAGEAR